MFTPKLIVTTALAFVAACSVALAQADQPAAFPGASGMVYLADRSCYLVAQDTKAPAPRGQFGIARMNPLGKFEYTELDVNWAGSEPGNDIEALAAMPGKPNEYLAMESGYWQGKYGRVLHIRLDWPAPTGSADELLRIQAATPAPEYSSLIPAVTLLATYQMPQFEDECEGFACSPLADGRLLVLFGLRGGRTPYSGAWLRWGKLDLASGSFEMRADQARGMEIFWPSPSYFPGSRGISDLYIDGQGMLWVSGADDGGDFGPFRSYIQAAGRIDAETEWPVQLYLPLQLCWEVDGFKIEAITGPGASPGSVLTFATDDEMFGGVLRPLPAAVPPKQQPYYGPGC